MIHRLPAASAALACALALGACGERALHQPPGPTVAEFRGNTMATTYVVKVATAAPLSAEAEATLREAVHAAVDNVDRKMSTWKPDSELSRLNRHAERTPFPVSRETIAVLEAAREVSEASGGAFDVTVGPLVNAWGFGPEKRSGAPSAEEIASLKPRLGYRMLAVDAQALTVTKARPDVYADLSGIASGFGVDEVARLLDARGIADYMIEVGGEVRTRGKNAEGKPWQIAIARPDVLPQQAHFIVPLADLSLATSGDYRRYFEQDGKRYSHHIDPATGYPVQHRLASVSVVATQCVLADAYAAALIVLGPERGYRLAEEKHLAAYLILREPDGRFSIKQTPAFAALNGRLVEKP